MANLVKVIIDGKKLKVEEGSTIIQAADKAGIHIPRLCYHKRLSLAGKCRVCLVELSGFEKAVSSCTCKVTEGMKVKTNSALAVQSRKDVLEFLLANHPLDCPTCKRSNECELQNMVMENNLQETIYPENKRSLEVVNWTRNIQYVPSRCIHCMRCVRFCDEIAGKSELGQFNRGDKKTISPGTGKKLTSNLSGNILDICPVGALIDSQFAKKGVKVWELETFETIDTQDSILPSIYADIKDDKIMRIRGRENDDVNQEWISNRTRFLFPDLYAQRIETPRIENQEAEWPQALDFIMHKLQNTKPENIAGLVGNKLSLEDIYSFVTFMTDSVGSDNVAFISENKEIKDVVFETSIKEIDDADVIISVGTIFEKFSPVLNSRIFKSSQKEGFKFFHIGGELKDYPYEVNYLGREIKEVIKNSKEAINALEKSQNGQIFIDVRVLDSKQNGQAILKVFEDIQEKYGVKLNRYVTNTGYINSAKIKTDIKFEKNYQDVIQKLENEEIEILFVYGKQKLDEEIIKKAKFIVYVGTYGDEVSKIADVVLPSVSSTEKNSLWTNVEGKVMESKAVTIPYCESKVDWKIWRALSEYTGKPLTFNDLKELRANIKI